MHFFIIFYCMHVYIFLKGKKKIHLEKNKNILIFFFYNQIYEYMLDVSRITLIKINNKKTSIGLNFNISKKKKNLYYNSFFLYKIIIVYLV